MIGLDILADDVCVNGGWPILLVLKEGVRSRGGEELGKLFPCDDPFLEFFLGEFCWKQQKSTITFIVSATIIGLS